MFRASVYKTIVFTTALLCLLSFANAEQFAAQNAKEVTHYSGSEDFIGSRNTTDDSADIPQNELAVTVQYSKSTASFNEVPSAFQQLYTLQDIRGPPATAFLI
ncbi:MAG: hypothetical protein Q7W55_05810 [Pseudohongiella sp.]|nr:hypothetical protein [Pseudohongiella sp.]MDO9518747.1 hypothetical protein [Pseudohongiella sp.]MDP2126785.1 hypothetical protein [Pseudohongiella sp.]